MLFRVGELIIYKNILALSKISDVGVNRGQNSRSTAKLEVKRDFSTNKGRNKCNTFFRVILNRKYTPYIIFIIQGHLQCQKVTLKVK